MFHQDIDYQPLHSLRLNKSTSINNVNFGTSRYRTFKSPEHLNNYKCTACIHQRQLSLKISLLKQGSINNSQPNHQYTQQLLNLKKSKQFLEVLLQKNQQDYKVSLDSASTRLTQLAQQIDNKNKIIQNLQANLAMNLLAQQYGNTSFVGAFIQNSRQVQDPIHSQRSHTAGLMVQIKRLNSQLQQFRLQNEQSKKKIRILEDLQLRLKQYQIYAKQYDSMRLLIHKMQTQKQDISRKHTRTIQDITKKHKDELHNLQLKLNEAKHLHPIGQTLIDVKQRQISNTRDVLHYSTKVQFEHLQEVIQQRDTMIDHLESKITCIESELTFLKNRYGYLLKFVWNSPQLNQLGSNSELQDYCIERVGRHNLSNGKQSLIGLNLSPIKKR